MGNVNNEIRISIEIRDISMDYESTTKIKTLGVPVKRRIPFSE
jgi:hypothetical protein